MNKYKHDIDILHKEKVEIKVFKERYENAIKAIETFVRNCIKDLNLTNANRLIVVGELKINEYFVSVLEAIKS